MPIEDCLTLAKDVAKETQTNKPLPVEAPTLRRNTRERKKPDYYGNFVKEKK